MDLMKEIDSRQVLISGVEFGENELIITYQEKRHIGESAMKSQSIWIAVDSERLREEYMELQDDLANIVDRAEVSIIENPIEG